MATGSAQELQKTLAQLIVQMKSYSQQLQKNTVDMNRSAQAAIALSKAHSSVAGSMSRMSGANSLDKLFSAQSKSIRKSTSDLKLFNSLLDSGSKNGLGSLQKLSKEQANLTGRTHDWGGAITATDKKLIKLTAKNTALKGMATHVRDIGTNWQWVGRNMTAGISLPILLAGGAALKKYLEYNKELTRVQKVYGDSGGKLWKAHKKDVEALIETTGHFYALDRAQTAAMAGNWAAMGYKMGDGVRTGLGAVMAQTSKLSILGDIDVETAQETVRSIIAVFSRGLASGLPEAMRSEAITKFTDQMINQLNAIDNSTSLKFSEIATSLPKVAQAGKLFNLSAAQTVSILADMRDRGIGADTAANALGVAFSRISGGVKAASKALKENGLELFDPKRGTKGIEFLDQLSGKLNELTDSGQLTKRDSLLNAIFSGRQTPKLVDTLLSIQGGLKLIKDTAEANKGEILTVDMAEFTNAGDFVKGLISSGEYLKVVYGEGSAALAKLNNDAAAGDANSKKILEQLEASKNKEISDVKNSPAFRMQQLKTDFVAAAIKMGGAIFPIAEKILSFFNKIATAVGNIPEKFAGIVAAGLGIVALIGPITAIIGQFAQMSGVIASVAASIRLLGPGMTEVSGAFIQGIGGEDGLKRAADKAGVKTNMVGDKTMVNKKDYKRLTDAASTLNLEADAGLITSQQALTAAVQANTMALTGIKPGSVGSGLAGEMIDGDDDLKGLSKAKDGTWRRNGKIISADANARATTAAERIRKQTDVSDLTQAADGTWRRKGKFVSPELSKLADKDVAMKKVASRGVGKKMLLGASLADDFGGPGYLEKLNATKKGVKGFLSSLVSTPVGALKAGAGFAKRGAGAAAHAATGGGGLVGVGKTALKVGKTAAFAPLAGMASMAGALAPLLPILAAIAAVVAVIIIGFKVFKDHSDKLKPGMEAIGKAIKPIKDAVMAAIEPFREIKDMLSGDGGSKFFEGIAKGANWVMEKIAAVIGFMTPYINQIIGIIGGVFGFVAGIIKTIIKLVSGDLWGALAQLRLAFFYLAKAAVSALALIPRAFAMVIRGIGNGISKIPGIGKTIAGPIQKAGKLIDGAADAMTRSFDKRINNLKKGAASIPKSVKAPKVDPGSGAGDAGAGAGTEYGEAFNNSAEEAVDDGFLSALKSRVDKVMDKIKDSFIKSFDKMVEERMKVFDDQIKAIDDLEKKENELLRVQEYNSQRAELIRKRSLNAQNYERNRALAIYEGRIDDARTMDIEHVEDNRETHKAIVDLDDNFNRQTVKNARDAKKEEIQIAKDAAKQMYDDQKEALKERLDLATEYTARNVGEMQSQMDQMTAVMQGAIPGFKFTGESSMAAYAKAIRDARTDLHHEGFWAGKTAGDAAVAGAQGSDTPPPPAPASEPTYESSRDIPGAVSNVGPAGPAGPTGPKPTKNQARNAYMGRNHSGGPIRGREGSNEIPAILQDGEYVIRKSSVDKFGKNFFYGLNQGDMPRFHSGGFAGFGKRAANPVFDQIRDAIQPRIAKIVEARREEAMAKAAAAMSSAGAVQRGELNLGEGGGNWRDITSLLTNAGARYSVGSTTGGKHTTNSWHYKGKAVDLHGDLMGIWKVLAGYQSNLRELFHAYAPYGIKNGQRIAMSDKVKKGHTRHVHAAIYDEGGWLNPGRMAKNTSGKKEFILSNEMIKSLSQGLVPLAMAVRQYNSPMVKPISVSGSVAAGGVNGSVQINVDTFIGQEAWFEAMMRKYNLIQAPAADRRVGATNRTITSYKSQTERSRR